MKKIITTAALLATVSFGAANASADTPAAAAFDAHYLNNSSCSTCHQDPNAGGSVNIHTAVGTAWIANGGRKDAGPTTQAQWDALDADQAITAAGFAVDPNWTLPAAPAASGGSSGGCITSSATTPLMMVLAMLALGFFVRRKKD